MEKKMNDLEFRRAQADLYEHVAKGDQDNIKPLFDKYKDLLNSEIIIGTNFTCTCYNEFEGHPINHSDALDYGLDRVLAFIRQGYCTCGAENPSHFRERMISLSLVHAAAGFQHLHILKLLHKYGCNLNVQTEMWKKTPLSYAVRANSEEIIDFLLQCGVDVNLTCQPDLNTPLHEAIQFRYSNVVSKLLKARNLKINQQNRKEETALLLSVRHHLHKSFIDLLEAGADCNIQDKRGNSALMVGVVKGSEYVQPLIEKGADPNIKNFREQSALSFALHMERVDIVCYLLEHGANPNLTSNDGSPPVVDASIMGNREIMQALIKHKADTGSKNVQGYTALHVAAWNGYVDIVHMLLDTGLPHDTQTLDKNTPLALAAHGNYLSVMDILLPLGCNVNNSDKDADTALHYATFNGNYDMVINLLKHGADPNCRNNYNATPIWNAVYKCNIDIVKCLLVRNVDLDVPSCGIDQYAQSDVATLIYNQPKSLLYVAADRNNTDIVMTLMLAGCNPYQENWILSREFPHKMEDNSLLKSMLVKFTASPPRLMSICKQFLRKRFGKNIIKSVNCLEIPQNLKDFLTMRDFLKHYYDNMV